MKHKIWYDDKHEITFIEFVGDYMRKDVDEVISTVKNILADKPIKQLLTIMSVHDKIENRETREASSKGLATTGATDIAFVGGSAANRMVARVLIKTGVVKINGDFFKSEEKAIEWLKSKRS